ncbi:MAG: hypothetical protein Q8L26_01535 [Candidatus Omnitrophota bacterium]|nr:hypothetical protein [Candidatus Omnitrophota bacterium]
MKNYIFIIVAGVILVLSGTVFSFAQDTNQTEVVLPEAKEAGELTAQEAENKTDAAASEENLEWVWGDVVSVDAVENKFTVKYPDYETDAEKEIIFYTDERTVFENAQSLGEIQPPDSASVDYFIDIGGRNIARLVSVEKMKQEPYEDAPAQ